MMQQHFVYCGDEGVVSQQQTRRGDTEIWAPSVGIYKKKQKTSDSDGKSIARRPRSTPPSLKY